MEKTKDYRKFKFLSSNRQTSEQLVLDLMSSIKQKNLLEYRPILVDQNMGVIDGQHRLKAAERLGVEIYYQVKVNAGVADMLTLNAVQCKWSWSDFMHAYCAEGNTNYLRLKSFMEKYNLNLACAVCVFEMRSKIAEDGDKFKRGKFIYPENDTEFHVKAECFNEVCSFIKNKTVENFNFQKNKSFCFAFCSFMNIKELNYLAFMKKLALRLDRIRKCALDSEYLKMLFSIYNFKNQQPLYFSGETQSYKNEE